jgi:hypothetical protein
MSSNSLIGSWVLMDSSNDETDDYVEVLIEESGRMIYGIFENEKWQLAILSYRVDGNFIISDQPSQPNEERTAFSFSEPDRLKMEYGGETSTFMRIRTCSFAIPPRKRTLLQQLGFRK